jgi:hypothetical protein
MIIGAYSGFLGLPHDIALLSLSDYPPAANINNLLWKLLLIKLLLFQRTEDRLRLNLVTPIQMGTRRMFTNGLPPHWSIRSLTQNMQLNKSSYCERRILRWYLIGAIQK